MKFKVGDIVEDEFLDLHKVVKIAEEGETVEGPWSFGHSTLTIGQKSYILEDEEGKWCYDLITNENELEVVTVESLKTEFEEERKVIYENLKKGFQRMEILEENLAKKLKDLEDLKKEKDNEV